MKLSPWALGLFASLGFVSALPASQAAPVKGADISWPSEIEANGYTSATVGQRIIDGASGAKLVTIADCGHIPSVEQPAAFVKAITAFA